MILRKVASLLILLSVAPSLSFQPTQAHFPTPATIHAQFCLVTPAARTPNPRSTTTSIELASERQHQRRIRVQIPRLGKSQKNTCLRATSVLPQQPSTSLSRTKETTECRTFLHYRPATTVVPVKANPNGTSSSPAAARSFGLFRLKKKNIDDQHHQQSLRFMLDEAAYQRRKDEWARKYTSVDALRSTFGSNRNRLWGDLDAQTSRRLYKTLLPRALLELYRMGVHPEDLAPLAYRARVAAKLYARERCSFPFRIAADLYDGFRQWRRYGSFDTHGMTFQQVWEKYSAVILEQQSCASGESDPDKNGDYHDLTAEDVTAQICLKILERSCKTNSMVDNLFLSRDYCEDGQHRQDLEHFTNTLEQDVRRLLQPIKQIVVPSEQELQRIRTLRRVARMKRRLHLHKSLHRNSNDRQKENIKRSTHPPASSRHKFPWR